MRPYCSLDMMRWREVVSGDYTAVIIYDGMAHGHLAVVAGQYRG